jgi:phosphoglycerate kinase
MRFGINTLDDFDVRGKTVLLRVDINQPVDKEKGQLEDITRIKGCVPTVTELAEKGAKLVILAHQGSDIEYQNYYHLGLHAQALRNLTRRDIKFAPDVCGPFAQEKIKNLKEGEILLLDNVRFMAEEMTLFETKLKLSAEQQAKTQVVNKLAPLADLYVCDAFAAAHRAQPTLTAFQQLLPSAMGRLFEKEYSVLVEILEKPKKPLVFVLGGAKIQDAFLMMDKVLREEIADTVLAGGLVANVMLIAKGVDIGKPSYNYILKNNLGEFIDKSRALLSGFSDRIMLPVDLAYADEQRHNVCIEELPVSEPLLDIGDKTSELFAQKIQRASTVFVNGPVGVFEKPLTEHGTKTVWQALAETNAFTVLGGGDSVAATNKYGLADKMGYICTGGGAMVRFLSGEELPVVAALKYAGKKFGNERG